MHDGSAVIMTSHLCRGLDEGTRFTVVTPDASGTRSIVIPVTTNAIEPNSAAGTGTVVSMPQCRGVSNFLPGRDCCHRSRQAFDLDA
jgi:hypothetical protein